MCSDLWLEEMQEISDIEFNCVIGIRNKTEWILELNGTEKTPDSALVHLQGN